MKVLLKEIRIERKLSLREVSKLTGIEEWRLLEFEEGQIPKVEEFVELLDGLRLDFEDLVKPF